MRLISSRNLCCSKNDHLFQCFSVQPDQVRVPPPSDGELCPAGPDHRVFERELRDPQDQFRDVCPLLRAVHDHNGLSGDQVRVSSQKSLREESPRLEKETIEDFDGFRLAKRKYIDINLDK